MLAFHNEEGWKGGKNICRLISSRPQEMCVMNELFFQGKPTNSSLVICNLLYIPRGTLFHAITMNEDYSNTLTSVRERSPPSHIIL